MYGKHLEIRFKGTKNNFFRLAFFFNALCNKSGPQLSAKIEIVIKSFWR